jgi:hypothetical protein
MIILDCNFGDVIKKLKDEGAIDDYHIPIFFNPV